ncbi:LytR C-terminal domain-containing protein [Mobilicoccus massiliensis]|uniref:LytR C-terminal domain-containing protein n=1 Tax=Mobilicoccus massiliensis TaxID=1522310 RepID=UPI001141F28E|nr:LytR C-terminal domain-containing protein [Mobilicoccus massiliensis]
MSYAYEAGMPTARRRRRRAMYLTTLGLVVLALAVAGVRAFVGNDATDGRTPAATPSSCPEPPAGITVDVLNATSRAGLASHTADTLRAQRFTVGEAINAPAGTVVEVPAEIRHGPAAATGAKVLAHHIRGSVLKPIQREGTRVDLVIGNEFGAVTPPTTTPAC